MSDLGKKVRELRLSRGLTQERLAEKAQAGKALISALESGRRKYVRALDIEHLAKALGIPESDLWGLIPGGKSKQRYIAIF